MDNTRVYRTRPSQDAEARLILEINASPRDAVAHALEYEDVRPGDILMAPARLSDGRFFIYPVVEAVITKTVPAKALAVKGRKESVVDNA